MSDLHDARVEAAAKGLYEDPRLTFLAKWEVMSKLDPANAEKWRVEARRALAAADAVVTVDGLQERIEDTLAYYQCRETNPKADHPSMGYHAFSEEQREFLRARKAEAAAEIVRMILTLLRGGEDDEAVA